MFPQTHDFTIGGGSFYEGQTVNVFNIVISPGDKNGSTDLLSPEKWQKLISKLEKKGDDDDTTSESDDSAVTAPEPDAEPEPERLLEVPEVQTRITIFTGVDKALKKLKRSVNIIFTITPAIAGLNKPFSTIVWKTLHFEKTTTMQSQIIWGNRMGFCVLQEEEDGTLRPGDLRMVVNPGCAAVFKDVDGEQDFSEEAVMPFKTDNVALCNMTDVSQRFALCSIDPKKPESDQFSPVVDLDSVESVAALHSGKFAFACGPPVMLQAYVVSNYRERQPIDATKLNRPLFVNAASKAQAIDIRTLNPAVTTVFRLYSNNAGNVILEKA